jgi:hypothetical protein
MPRRLFSSYVSAPVVVPLLNYLRCKIWTPRWLNEGRSAPNCGSVLLTRLLSALDSAGD